MGMSVVGLKSLADYTTGTALEKLNRFKAILPQIDSRGDIVRQGYLDHISPPAVAQLLAEVSAIALIMSGGIIVPPVPTQTVQFKYARVEQVEGNSGVTPTAFTLTRTIAKGPLTVVAVFVPGTSSPSDFEGNVYPGDRTFVFSDGSLEAFATIRVQGDLDQESNETYSLIIQPSADYVIGTGGSATGVIINDDYPAGMTTLAARYAPPPGDSYVGSAPEGLGANVFESNRRNQRLTGSIQGNQATEVRWNWDTATNTGFALTQISSNSIQICAYLNGNKIPFSNFEGLPVPDTANASAQSPVRFEINSLYVPATDNRPSYTEFRVRWNGKDTGYVRSTAYVAGAEFSGTKARIYSSYSNYFGAIKIEGLSDAGDLLIWDAAIESKTGILSGNLSYYLDVAGPLMASVKSTDGTILVPAEELEVLSNPTPGAARVRLRTAIPQTAKLTNVRVEVYSTVQAPIRDDMMVIFPEPMEIGQNVSGLGGVFRPQATFTNAFQQGYWQDSQSPFQTYSPGDGRGGIDLNGWPTKNEIDFWYRQPDQLTTVRIFVTGDNMENVVLAHGLGDDTMGLVERSAITRVNSSTFTWTLRGDRRIATGGPHNKLTFKSIDLANPPKNLKMYIEGDDITRRFLPSFINFLKETAGWLRFMDDRAVNGELTRYDVPWVWENRPRQNNGSMQPIPLEDFVELCYRSNRGMLYNVHSSFGWEDGGLDFYDKELDIIYGVTPGVYITPGFSAPGGVPKEIAPELDNEIWNQPGFGFIGSYQYLVRVAARRGVPGVVDPFNEADGALGARALPKMRNVTHKKLMARLQARIAGWRARTVQCIGVQMGESDRSGLMLDSTWGDMKPYLDMFLCAPYVPNDPNAGGRDADLPDKSPDAVNAYLAKSARYEVGPILRAQAARSLELGYRHGIYEVNVSIPSLGLNVNQNKALQKSQGFYDVWMNDIIPMMAACGGPVMVYRDVDAILDSSQQQWGLMHILNSEYNKSWEAVRDWSAANPK